MDKHTDREYESKLVELRRRIQTMAKQVESMLGDSVTALTERDIELARRTIMADRLVNVAELETDELCLVVLAKWQPMASDLRFITLALKMVTDLERIGDLAVNICERAIDLASLPQYRPYEDIPRMGVIAREMVARAIRAFMDGDASEARAVIVRDDELDDLYTEVFRDVLEVMAEKPESIQRGIHVQSVAKWLERVGDHACNLAEQVIFLVEGNDIRHAGRGGPDIPVS
ncbi:MAG: phosphate transport system protein [Myxococcota bacterium]|jgi:phosphate transport system protein